MSDITNRQAYVFLQDGDITKTGDQFFRESTCKWEETFAGHIFKESERDPIRRPIATPEQTDGLTVWDEYAKSALSGLLALERNSIDYGVSESIKIANRMMKARAVK